MNWKKYYDYDNIKYKGIRDIINLFDLSIDEVHDHPKKTFNALNNNHIEYESKGDKDKTIWIKEYIDLIRPYLSDIINDHKSQGEWKIQLTMSINLISSKGSDETRTMHTKSDDIKIMIGKETDETFRFYTTKISKRFIRKNKKKWICFW